MPPSKEETGGDVICAEADTQVNSFGRPGGNVDAHVLEDVWIRIRDFNV